MLRKILTLFFVFLATMAWSQDLHFTHYNKNPLYINPALAGKFAGKYKMMLISRDQWSTVSVPYKSFGAMVEASSLAGKSPLGTALSLYRDVAGDSRFTTTKVDIGASYTVPINYNRSSVITFGLQGGLHHYGLDYSKLQFDNQYTEESGFNPGLPARENFNQTAVLSPAASAGVAFLKQAGRYTVVAGVGAYNLLQGDLGFTRQGVDDVQQQIRLNYYLSVEYLMGKVVLVPSFLRTQSSVLHETIIGMEARYQPQDRSPEFSLGTMYRFQDALALTVGINYSPWEIGFSYDINTSTLYRASRGYGAIEVFLSYIIQPTNQRVSEKNRFQVCPSFI
ncbi:MAG: PorP/SprF family type IX secretion system membrane protein [Luteibaculum sp.]